MRHRLARGESIDGSRGNPGNDLTFEKFAWQWFEQYVVPSNGFNEQRMKRCILRSSLVPFFGRTPLAGISSRQIARYKAFCVAGGASNKTINNRLTVLRKCLSTAREWLDLPGAMPNTKRLKCAPPRTDFLSHEECEALLANADGVVFELILTALRTGMRQGELKALQWNSINWETRSLVVRHSRDDYRKILVAPKSNRERQVPLDVDVYDLLDRRKKSTGYVFLDTDGEPFNFCRMERRLSAACKKAGLRKIGWHALRHTFASHLAMRGVPLTAVQALLGHTSITTTMRYSHVAPSTLRSAIDLLNPKQLAAGNAGQTEGNIWIQEELRKMTQEIASSRIY